jgi:NarL family two-component system response regulator YdfI
VMRASPLVRAGLENTLAAEGVEVAGAFSSVELLADHIADGGADVFLIDASGDQFETVLGSIEQLELKSEAAVVPLADHPPPGWFALPVRAGIGAVLPTGAAPEQLVAAMEAAAAGLVVIDRGHIDSTFPAATPASRPFAELFEPLTPPEPDVLQMLASGLGNKEIATRLTISEHIVKFHVASHSPQVGLNSPANVAIQARCSDHPVSLLRTQTVRALVH